MRDLSLKGIFVSHESYLTGTNGGVQVCTREYLALLEAAGVALQICPFANDRRASTRMLRRINSSPYLRPAEPELIARLELIASQAAPDVIFLNQVSLAPIVRELRSRLPQRCRIILLSHGLESTDLVHFLRLKRKLPLTGRARPNASVLLGSCIATEARTRPGVDGVFTLSPFDADLERWIGAREVCYLPRTVQPLPIVWKPNGDRLGFLGTLDHAPNLEGLVSVLEQFAQERRAAVHVRVVGGPASIGAWLSRRYGFVDYLGPLDDQAVRNEATTWSAFLHPIFCLPRGCSTKLATGISWQIPIVTTTPGRRGYEWRSGSLTIADEPAEFAAQALRLLDRDLGEAARSGVVEVSRTGPTQNDNAKRVQRLIQAALASTVASSTER
jgi:hypothetical protein